MNTGNGVTVATGTQINNHLYKLDNFIIQKPKMGIPKLTTPVSHTFATTEPFTSWETWHQQFGHLGMSSIQTLLNKKLVTGLNIDLQSLKYDCEAYTLAKQQVTPFPKAATLKVTKPGELTHTDLWGKYPVQSIHGNQYFHTFLNDKTQYPHIRFLKHKDEMGQSIKDYVTYLKACRMQPQAFHCDQGTEFINDDLLRWLRQQGIEVQMTVPYSLSQNGAAERLNRTLVELAHAMMISRDVPTYVPIGICHTTRRIPTPAGINKNPPRYNPLQGLAWQKAKCRSSMGIQNTSICSPPRTKEETQAVTKIQTTDLCRLRR